MRTRNWGYVTLLSTVDYLPAVLVLHESLKRVKSHFPLVVGVTEDILNEVAKPLEESGCCIEPIKRLTYNQKTVDKYKDEEGASVLNTASKLSLFSLKWEKLVYIDADTIVLQNVDDLFNWPDGSMVKYPEDNGGFTGLMVFTPPTHNVELYEYYVTNTQCCDGDLIGKLWFQCKTNPAYQIPADYLKHYGVGIETEYFPPSQWSDYKILHFCNNPKPWIVRPENHEHYWYMHYYLSVLDFVIEKYHLE